LHKGSYIFYRFGCLIGRHGIDVDGGSNDGDGGGGGRAADAMLRREPWGEAVAACGSRRVAAWAGRRDDDGDAGARQGVNGRPRQWQLRMDETRAPRLPAATIVVDLLLRCSFPAYTYISLSFSSTGKCSFKAI
jgi:hypothetical protein